MLTSTRTLSPVIAGRSEEVGNKIASAASLVYDLAHQPILLLAELLVGPELLRVIHDCGKGMIDLISGSRYEIAQRSQFFFLYQLTLKTFLALDPSRDSCKRRINAWS